MGKVFKRLHITIFVIMLVLLVPTLTIWRQSQTYIVIMSWVAMAYASISSWQAARVEQKQDND